MRKLTLLLFILSINCSLFKDEQNLSCEDLVITSEESPEIIQVKGDPSGQWVVSGIENPEETGSNCEEGQECEVGIAEYRVRAAYPNPIDAGTSTTLSFDFPEENNLKIVLQNEDGSFQEVITDRILPTGSYSQTVGFESRSAGCYRIDFYFGNSEVSNAYGLILTE